MLIMRGVIQLPVSCPVPAEKPWDVPGTQTGLVGMKEAPGKPMHKGKLLMNRVSSSQAPSIRTWTCSRGSRGSPQK